jgi:branched-chain amino acid transport system substrate-binding protein
MSEKVTRVSRRQLLRQTSLGATAVGISGLAGCTGDGDSGSPTPTGDGGDTQDDGGNESTETKSTTELKLGAMAPLSGPFAALGTDERLGVEVAVEHANADFENLNVQASFKDSKLDPKVGLRRAKEFIEEENVHALVVGDGTTVTKAVSQYCGQQGVPMIGVQAASETITGKNCNNYAFRSAAHSYQNMKPTAEWAMESLGTSFVTMGSDYSWGHESVGNFVEVAEAKGGEAVNQLWPKFGTTDWSSYIQKAADTDADFVLIRAGGSDLVSAFKQIDSFGLNEDMEIVGIASHTAALGAGEAAIGMYGNMPYNYRFENEQNQRFVSDYQSMGDDSLPSTYSCSAYVGARFMCKAALESGTGPDELVSGLESVEISGPLGTQSIRECDHQANSPMWVGEFVANDDGDADVRRETVSEHEVGTNNRPCGETNCSL